MNSRFIYIILAIMLVLLVDPFIRPYGLVGHLFSTIFVAMIPLSSALAVTEDRKEAITILLIAAPFVILDGLSFYFASHFLMVIAIGFATFVIIIMIIVGVVIMLFPGESDTASNDSSVKVEKDIDVNPIQNELDPIIIQKIKNEFQTKQDLVLKK